MSALALLVVVTTLTLGLVLQFGRWRGEYRAERQYTEQLLVQQNNKSDSPQSAPDAAKMPVAAVKLE